MANNTRELTLRSKTVADVGSRILDGGGLVGTVRLDRSANVVVGFEFRFRSPVTGKVRSIACGIWPSSSLKEIRSARDANRQLVENGVDPIETKKAGKLAKQADIAESQQREKERLAAAAAARARLTVSEFFNTWEKTELIDRKDKGADVRRMFTKDVFPKLGATPLADVRKGDIMAVVDTIKGRGVPRMARVVFSLLRQMMRFAVDRDYIESDPTAAIRKEKAVGKDAERDRVLSEDEIKQLSDKLPISGLSEQIQAGVWIMLSTLCRVGELSKAKWVDVDLEQGRWRIPPEAAKNGKEHIVSLSAFAASKFELLRQGKTSKTWVLPSRDGKTSLDEKTITKQIRDRQRTEQLKGRAKPSQVLLLQGGQWTSHDLRRSGATIMGELGVDGDVIEKCLNHKEQNRIKRTYQRQRSEQAMAAAWQLLGERLELLTSGADNVVTLKRQA